MKVNNKVDILEVFGDREKEIIMKVLEKYQINKIENLKKITGDYKVETDRGIVCLKKMRHGAKRIIDTSEFVEELSKIGFYNTPQYLKTSDKNVFVKHKNINFYATEWVNGSQCHLENIIDAKGCIKLLAKFHIASDKIDTRKLRIKNDFKNWPQIFNNNILELEKFKKIIRNKRLKNEFDLVYYKFIDNYILRSTLAYKILNDSNYYQLSKIALDKRTICHGSGYYETIIKDQEETYILNLNNIVIDLHINDLGRFIRKLMFKNEYQWDFSKAKLLIEAYNSEKRLSKEELEAMLALIIFPNKFCKLGKKRYIKHKNWNEVKYMHKLNRLIKYNELQQQFAEDYLNYVSSYV
jgi:CotS family spore coat protein